LATLVIVAYVANTLGKRDLVNPFSENDLAGLFWHYGFIAFFGFLISALALFFWKITEQNKRGLSFLTKKECNPIQ
jgi:hypothetical protein|tara:strand:- start:18601 stop:18828 length:228 start_codon:yes stop_codon:yes gene_type:complete